MTPVRIARRAVFVAPAVLAASLALSACGEKVLNTGDAVKLVRRGVVVSGGKAKSVKCPDTIKAKVGTTFRCTAQVVNGDPITFNIKVDKVSGNGGHMTIIGARQGKKTAGTP